ncbi:MAG: peptidoglycan DD-metalloendopeptidase family protein [Gammaproteobacteria bacterium]|nr:peptidoglycan DD-metalloendopeptidase family protein [Gammaproteobacteria bacterium]MCW8988261.1 peptidoglycan DD-metalloendopeptidase family protein [Gammaproteobacteria bacterium]MCW9031174.1 peptidoglycan DD-metalloendopeptidase family protein [Gammaproteobacteria bacterium]
MFLSYYKFFILASLTLLTTACGQFVPYEPGRDRNSLLSDKIVTHHHVKAGETLYSIAFEYGRDHRDVARWNSIPSPYTIYPKQKLRVIPISSDTSEAKQETRLKLRKLTRNKHKPEENKFEYVSSSKLQWSWPTQGQVVSTFSIRDPGRRGIDIEGRKGQPVNAAAAGRVVYRGNGLRGYGNLIIIKHNETYFSAYAHTEDVVVKEDEKVKLGQKLADMSNTGTDKTILHFEIRRNGKPVNPMKYLPAGQKRR